MIKNDRRIIYEDEEEILEQFRFSFLFWITKKIKGGNMLIRLPIDGDEHWKTKDISINPKDVTYLEMWIYHDGEWFVTLNVKARGTCITIGEYNNEKDAKKKYEEVIRLINKSCKIAGEHYEIN